MAEANSSVADSIAQLRHLKVEVKQPFCWLIKTPSIPRSLVQCEEEREVFLANLLKTFCSALWCSDAVRESDGIEGPLDVTWVTASDPVPRVVSVNSYLGDRVLLLFGEGVRSTAGASRLIESNLRSCQDAMKTLQATGADLLLYSMPDDIEWLIAQRH